MKYILKMIVLIKTKKKPIDKFLNLFFDILFFLQYGIYKTLNVKPINDQE